MTKPIERTPDETNRWADAVVTALVVSAAISIPALGFAAWYFNDGELLYWIALPMIFFMAG